MRPSGPSPGLLRRVGIVILGSIIVLFLIWWIALQGSGDDNTAMPTPAGSPVASRIDGR